MTLPTILATSVQQPGGLIASNESATAIDFILEQCSGITSGYSRARVQYLTGAVDYAKWHFNRMGGCGTGEVVIQGGMPDLDTASASEYEISIIRGATTLLYRGRIVRYEEFIPDGETETYTRIILEGYVSKLRDILVTTTIAAGMTVAQAVQQILTAYVQPNTRILFSFGDVDGSKTITGDLVFKSVPLLDVFRRLANIQSGIEWGITEGGVSSGAPAFYFKTESTTATSNTLQVILGKNLKGMLTQGSLRELYNSIKVLGAVDPSTGVLTTGSAQDATSISTYGLRERTFQDASLTDSADADEVAATFLALYKDGVPRLVGTINDPQERLEPDRSAAGTGTGSPAITATEQVTFRGVDGAVHNAPFTDIEYTYKRGCPFRLTAKIFAGAYNETVGSMIEHARREGFSAAERAEQLTGGGGGGPGTGTPTYLPRWDGGGTALEDSNVYDDGSIVNVAYGKRVLIGGIDVGGLLGVYDGSLGYVAVFQTGAASNGLAAVTIHSNAVTGNYDGVKANVTTTGFGTFTLQQNGTGPGGFWIIAASSGDAEAYFSINGVTDWAFGIDNSDSDKFKIGASAILGTSTVITLTTGGNVGIGTETPGSLLEVYGRIATTNGGDLFLNNNIVASGGSAANTGTAYKAVAAGYSNNADHAFVATAYLWSTSGTFAADTILERDAAGILGLRNSTAAQGFRIYNTYTSATNYERADGSWTSNVFSFGTQKGSGGGTARTMSLVTDATARLDLDGSGNGVWNEGGASVDFRFEGDTDANLLFLDGSADSIGIGTNSPTAFLHLKASATGAASLRFPAGTAPSSPNAGDVWNDSTQQALIAYEGGIKQGLVGCIFTQTGTVTVNNNAAEATLISGTGIGTPTLPANFWTVGKTIHLFAAGVYSLANTAGQTLNIRVKFGSVVLKASGAIARTQVINSFPWSIDCYITCITTGNNGTLRFQASGGLHLWFASPLGANSLYSMATTADVTVDTTSAAAMDVTADWNTAIGGDTITCTSVAMQVKN